MLSFRLAPRTGPLVKVPERLHARKVQPVERILEQLDLAPASLKRRTHVSRQLGTTSDRGLVRRRATSVDGLFASFAVHRHALDVGIERRVHAAEELLALALMTVERCHHALGVELNEQIQRRIALEVGVGDHHAVAQRGADEVGLAHVRIYLVGEIGRAAASQADRAEGKRLEEAGKHAAHANPFSRRRDRVQ
jgi:hypothetical protein